MWNQYAIYATKLQLCKNNYYVILIHWICNYNGNVMLMLFFIDPSKFDMWHYGDFWVKIIFFLKYWFSSSIMIVHFIWFYIMTCGVIESYHMMY
jgi:hypothetical protein